MSSPKSPRNWSVLADQSLQPFFQNNCIYWCKAQAHPQFLHPGSVVYLIHTSHCFGLDFHSRFLAYAVYAKPLPRCKKLNPSNFLAGVPMQQRHLPQQAPSPIITHRTYISVWAPMALFSRQLSLLLFTFIYKTFFCEEVFIYTKGKENQSFLHKEYACFYPKYQDLFSAI